MESKKIVRSLLFATLLSGSLIALGGVAQADCPAGYQNNLDIDVTTGVSVYYCTPSGEQNISQYDPNITPMHQLQRLNSRQRQRQRQVLIQYRLQLQIFQPQLMQPCHSLQTAFLH